MLLGRNDHDHDSDYQKSYHRNEIHGQVLEVEKTELAVVIVAAIPQQVDENGECRQKPTEQVEPQLRARIVHWRALMSRIRDCYVQVECLVQQPREYHEQHEVIKQSERLTNDLYNTSFIIKS